MHETSEYGEAKGITCVEAEANVSISHDLFASCM